MSAFRLESFPNFFKAMLGLLVVVTGVLLGAYSLFNWQDVRGRVAGVSVAKSAAEAVAYSQYKHEVDKIFSQFQADWALLATKDGEKLDVNQAVFAIRQTKDRILALSLPDIARAEHLQLVLFFGNLETRLLEGGSLPSWAEIATQLQNKAD